MSPERFENLLQLVAPLITKCGRGREPITPSERLTITLRYLASGESQQSLAFSFRVGRTTVCNIIKETCHAIWCALSETYLKPPQNQQDWKNIGHEFFKEWGFPNCLGALDGKHIAIECPGYSGSEYFNYKGFFSIVLMAMCDAKYCFTLVDVGNYGKDNDAQIFNNSAMGRAFINGHSLPYVIVADEIFGLKPWLMKPFPGKGLTETHAIFNYRLSRARRTIENAFGIVTARWRIFLQPIKANPTLVDMIVKACLCLHNYLRLTDNAQYVPSGFVDSEDSSGEIIPGDWRSLVNTGALLSTSTGHAFNRSSASAKATRELFVKYVNSQEGSLSWQQAYVNSFGQS